MNITHKTGFLYQSYHREVDGEWVEGISSWHRTFGGAMRAKRKNDEFGRVYRILGDDSTEEVQS